MKDWMILYMVVGMAWMMICLVRHVLLHREATWKTFTFGCPFNFIFWPISVGMAIRYEYRLCKGKCKNG